MNTASKGFAEKIVDQCIENPKSAFLLIPLGLALVLWGVSDAKYYRSLTGRPTLMLKEVSIISKPNDRGFTIPHVVGKSGDKEVSIPVSAKAARRLELEDEMGVVETADNSGQYVLRSSVDEQSSSIFFSIAGVPFNHIAVFGLAITIGACAWGAFARPAQAAAPE